MNWHKLKLFLLLSLVLFFPLFSQAQVSNVGIIPGNIWYSQDPFEDGDQIKIYTVVFNPDHRQLSGTVIFFNNETLLGTQKFTVLPKSMVDVSINWTASAGKNKIFAKIENARFLISENNYEEVYLAKNQTQESESFVEKKIIVEEVKKENEPEKENSKINDLIKEKTPAVISDNVEKTSLFLEDVRLNIKDDLEEKKETLKKEIKEINTSEAEKKKTSEIKDSEKNEKVEKVENSLEVEKNNLSEEDKENNILTDKITKQKSTNSANKEIKDTKNKITNPLKQIELFLLNFLYFIISNKVIFYIILLLTTFFILRFLWRLIF